MNPTTLEQLNEAYDIVKRRYSDQFSEFQLIDTSKQAHTTPQSTATEAATLILGAFQSNIS